MPPVLAGLLQVLESNLNFCLLKMGRLGGDSGGVVKLGPGLSFSWKRALGVTKAKRRVSKKTGMPLSRGGRRMKLGKWLGMKLLLRL